MKLSKKLKRQLKQKLITAVASTTAVLTLVAVGNEAGLFARFSELVNLKENPKSAQNEAKLLTANAISNMSRLSNTATTTYIYNAADLVAFRNNVNAGDDYEGKTVYLMNDIDLSTVCSSSLGSWTPINEFAGTFDGKGHTISGIYINGGNTKALFGSISGAILKNVSIANTTISGTYYIAALAASTGNSTIQNCHIKSNVTVTATSKNQYGSYVGGILANGSGMTVANCSNAGNITGADAYVGGISGVQGGTLTGCYNSGAVRGYKTAVGGVIGISYPSITISNCYNKGRVTGGTDGGGILGSTHSSAYVAVYNSYNVGYIDNTTNRGAIIGADKENISGLSNNYWLSGTSAYGRGYHKTNSGAAVVNSNTLMTYTVVLGSAFAYDVYNQNGGYPVLAWQNETTVMQLDQNQAYIKVGTKLPLNIQIDEKIGEKIGNNYATTNFTWKSTNEDVATVDSKGVVTGISDGYTAIYAHHEASNLYAMAIVNVAKNVATPQVETGNGFAVILKADGTVWTIGNNSKGQLGNGTTEKSNIPVQVKTDEDTNLENVIKIAVGTEHVMALTKQGNIYSWGTNNFGQLGQNNTIDSPYAKIVLGPDGTSYIGNIVDITAGVAGSGALDYNGNVYVWGRGSYGEIGNQATTDKLLPTKANMKNVIRVAMNQGEVSALTSEGTMWSWGRNDGGQLGINCYNNTSYPMKTALQVSEISNGGMHSVHQKIDGKIYVAGPTSYGRLGINSTSNLPTYTTISLPSTVTDSNKVKYFKAGRLNTSLLLTDGTIWQTGCGISGELGDGSNNTTTTFVQGKTKNGNLENVSILGKNNGDAVGSEATGYTLNTAVILEDGNVYMTGDNQYGQIGDNTTKATNYYKQMGFAYLDYEEKTVEIVKDVPYTIDLSKLKYITSSCNVYNNDKSYSVGQLKYTIEDGTLASVSQDGIVSAIDKTSGITKVKIEDITNGFETYFTLIVNKLEETDTVLYIYNANDMVRFRDSVNNGDDYEDKTVYIMTDIDMSTVCSKEIGTWEPIGNEKAVFQGTLEGNENTIRNLYVNANKSQQGLFSYIVNAQIRNITFEDSSVTGADNVGMLAGITNNTVIENCHIKGNSSVTCTSRNYYGSYVGGFVGNSSGRTQIRKCSNAGSVTGASNYVGGIVGVADGVVESCYNSGTIRGYDTYTGGIIGINYQVLTVNNCYNIGNVTGVRSVGGIVGGSHGNSTTGLYIYNSYSKGVIKGEAKTLGGILGSEVRGRVKSMGNNYWLSGSGPSYGRGEFRTNSSANVVAANNLKNYASTLGTAYREDQFNINNGYPILWWQAPEIELNKKQVYIKPNEQVNLSIIQNEQVEKILGKMLKITDFTWSSYDTDIATVDSNAVITGVADGYTTIYGYNAEYNVYIICVVNVAKEVANAQIETGEGLTAILKPDGTVWTIGNNCYGQCRQWYK